LNLIAKNAIDLMVVAVEHIRDCERCGRLYGAALDVLRQERGYEPHPWRVLDHCSRELHECEHWPKGI